MSSTAAAALKRAILRRSARSAIIKDAAAFERLYAELQQAMTRAWSEQMRKGIAHSLDRLRDLGAGQFTRSDGQIILETLEQQVGRDAIKAALREPVINLSDPLYRLGNQEVSQAVGVDTVFNKSDHDALNALQEANLHWVGESWDSNSRQLLERSLNDYFTNEGITREQLARRFAEDFAQISDQGTPYWTLLADHTATKTREIGRVSAYQRADIEYVQIRAHIDARTSEICRSLHGRVIPVSKLAAQRDAYLSATKNYDLARAKGSWAMLARGTDLNARTQDLPANVASPPYHFRCRSITVAYWHQPTANNNDNPAPEYQQWKRKAYDRETLTRKETAALIERSKAASWRNAQALQRHINKHTALATGDMERYNNEAINLIRRAKRDVYLSMRQGRLHATFSESYKNAKGQQRWRTAVVDVGSNELLTLHTRGNLKSRADEIQAMKQPKGRGIQKWLST